MVSSMLSAAGKTLSRAAIRMPIELAVKPDRCTQKF